MTLPAFLEASRRRGLAKWAVGVVGLLGGVRHTMYPSGSLLAVLLCMYPYDEYVTQKIRILAHHAMCPFARVDSESPG